MKQRAISLQREIKSHHHVNQSGVSYLLLDKRRSIVFRCTLFPYQEGFLMYSDADKRFANRIPLSLVWKTIQVPKQKVCFIVL